MKLFGLVMCAGGLFFCGLRGALLRKQRIRALRELCFALEIMQDELAWKLSDMSSLCAVLGEQSAGCAAALFRLLASRLDRLGETRFEELWSSCVMETCGVIGHRAQDALLEAGKVLGRYDAKMQVRELARCCGSLQKQYEQAERAYPEERRLLLGLGACAGLLLGVLLV